MFDVLDFWSFSIDLGAFYAFITGTDSFGGRGLNQETPLNMPMACGDALAQANNSDTAFFRAICNNSDNILTSPRQGQGRYQPRAQTYDLTLTHKDEYNFIAQNLYKDYIEL